jgi:hypothetical protein
MGMYTELNISVKIKAEDETKKILSYMTGRSDMDFEIPSHPLFSSPRWKFMLKCDSVYFDHVADSALYGDLCDNKSYILNVRCDLKDYDDEIKHFLDWIYPFTNTRGFIGYTRYEEDEDPTLIYFTDSGVEYKAFKN